MSVDADRFLTPMPWPRRLEQYGSEDTYQRAAAWLQDCPTVADWGGAMGCFRRYLPASCDYTIVDGTQQTPDHVLADLCDYHAPSDGILLRHVIDNTFSWKPILRNAVAAFRQRLVVVTFIPDGERTHRIEQRNGWPYWQFRARDLRKLMGPSLVRDELVDEHHPEHIYYLERA